MLELEASGLCSGPLTFTSSAILIGTSADKYKITLTGVSLATSSLSFCYECTTDNLFETS